MTEDSLIGLQLDEYRLEALLGRGGMARVYRGLDMGLNRYVAVKVIDTLFRSDEEYVKRFKVEAQAIARLDHPHVVRLYRYGEVNGVFYMAMQFIEGADLGYLLESYRLDGEFIPSQDALRLVKEICQALDYIHAHGIIHRDIKPSNIMLTRDEARAILTDFGLVLRAEVGTRGEIFGSPQYIAPEQAISSANSVPQSDLYSLGVILFEMFTGVLPFEAAKPMDIAVMHMSSPPPSPRIIRPKLSPEIEAVILKSLEKKPEDRYQTGRALALALERALHLQPEQIAPTSRSIPERVTIGLAAHPLPSLPPGPAAITPSMSAVKTQADPASREEPSPSLDVEPSLAAREVFPVERNSLDQASPNLRTGQTGKKAPWLIIGAAALVSLCLIACLAIAGLAYLMRPGNQVAGIAQERSGATSAPQSTIAPTALEDFRLKFWRCEDDSCLLVENSGSGSFPLSDLMLQGKDGSLSGQEWTTASLEPGQCVKVVKDQKSIGHMPKDVQCEMIGQPLVRDGKARFWANSFTIYYQNHKIVDCIRNGSWCEVLVPR